MITHDYIYICMYIHMYRQYMRSISWNTNDHSFCFDMQNTMDSPSKIRVTWVAWVGCS